MLPYLNANAIVLKILNDCTWAFEQTKIISLADFLSFDGKRRPQLCHNVTDPPAQIFEEKQGRPFLYF
jgi:hypothetical protein